MEISSNVKKIAIAVIVILAVILMIYGYRSFTGRAVEPGKYDDFANYLTSKGAVMYGTEWCTHCKNQKGLFGSSFELVNYVDCDKNREECLRAGVEGYPTWKINGVNYPGTQSLSKLAELTGYEGSID